MRIYQNPDCLVFLAPFSFARASLLSLEPGYEVACTLLEDLVHVDDRDGHDEVFWYGAGESFRIRGDVVVAQHSCSFDDSIARVSVMHAFSEVYDSRHPRKAFVLALHHPRESPPPVHVRAYDVPELRRVVRL